MQGQFHETFQTAEHALPPDRHFGLAAAAVLICVGLWPLVKRSAPFWELLGAALVVLAIALIRPSLLHWPNRAWSAFGRLLGRVTTPVFMSILFLGVFTPMAMLIRRRRRDPLRLQCEPDHTTYWITRPPESAGPLAMKRQF
jgi:peptidoglycan biosynthesis protein MviN/MurJ (putative lipid II flippase)